MKNSAHIDRPHSKQIRKRPIFEFNCFTITFGAVILTILLVGNIFSGFVDQNTKAYWKFVKNVTPADIKQIEVQRTNFSGTGIDTPLMIDDKNTIANFVSAIKTIQAYEPNHPFSRNSVKVKLWLTNDQTIEFECYTMEGQGNTIFVGYIWLTPNIYSFGNGYAKFPASEFYDWLISTGINFK